MCFEMKKKTENKGRLILMLFKIIQKKEFLLILVTSSAFSMKFRNVMYCFHLLQINILLFLPFSISSKFSLQYSTKRQRKMDSALSMGA